MTTQWNPAQAPGDTDGADREGDAPATPDNGPWRGYTVPVPEHPDHARPGGEAEPAHDGISAYPGEASAAPREPSGPAAEESAAPGGEDGTAASSQRRS